ncbi:MAG TPA: amidohydrolase family protein [Chthonomonadaceae bacterium]|nr:amidohydrolase family protein [Chthonomonadaceae bacterium]
MLSSSHRVDSDLAHFIGSAAFSDTHEHLQKEEALVQSPPDVLVDLFSNYVTADLVVAGATQDAVKQLTDPANPDVRARFAAIQPAWERCRQTGYGEAVRLIARQFYHLEEITPEAVERAQGHAAALRQPGMRLQALRDAGIDHVQVDDFCWPCVPDASGPDFFLYDLSWLAFCNGQIETEEIQKEVGIEVRDLPTLRAAMEALFAKYGPCAIAVKAQHAYSRTLQWAEHDEAEVAGILSRALTGAKVSPEERCALGDWCWARGVELAAEYNLPFKIHTGYYAGHSAMPVDRIRSGHLCLLLNRYPKTRFVLMHIAYPYSEELLALAKHYPNVWVDLCWAWSINPYAATDFVRRFIHAVPANKLFGFGGDSFWPWASVAYAAQARHWLTRALEAEVVEGLLTEAEGLALAERFLQGNQRECFDLEGTRAAIRERATPAPLAQG